MALAAALINKIVFWLLLALLILTVIPYGTVDMWWEAVFECAVFMLTGLWLIEMLLRGTCETKGLFFITPLFLITVYAFAQTLQWPIAFGRLTTQHTLSIDRYQTYLTARKMLALTLYLALVWVHTSNAARFRWLIRIVISVGLASAIFGIARQLIQSPDSQVGFFMPFLFYGVGYGQFIYHNLFAYLMEMTFALLVGLMVGGGVRKDLILIYAAIAIVMWAGLVLSNSRGGVLGFICQSVFMAFIILRWHSKNRLEHEDSESQPWSRLVRSKLVTATLAVAAAIVLLVSIIWMGGEQFSARLGEGITTDVTVDNLTRTATWRSTWLLIKHQPWTGTGFGTYSLAIPEYQTGAGRFKLEQAHNDYLDLVANGGVVGLLLGIWFTVNLIIGAMAALRSKDKFRRAAALGAAAGILSLAVHSLVDFGLQITGIATVFATLIVIGCAGRWVESTGKTGTPSSAPIRSLTGNTQASA